MASTSISFYAQSIFNENFEALTLGNLGTDITGTTAGQGGWYTTAATTAALVTAIENERRVELAHEGHRWFDLRRYDKIASLGVTEPFRALWPIPLREFQTSAGVVEQNDGY